MRTYNCNRGHYLMHLYKYHLDLSFPFNKQHLQKEIFSSPQINLDLQNHFLLQNLCLLQRWNNLRNQNNFFSFKTSSRIRIYRQQQIGNNYRQLRIEIRDQIQQLVFQQQRIVWIQQTGNKHRPWINSRKCVSYQQILNNINRKKKKK